jgi:hypothetical protein
MGVRVAHLMRHDGDFDLAIKEEKGVLLLGKERSGSRGSEAGQKWVDLIRVLRIKLGL